MKKTVIVTGFGPFLQHGENPSDLLARTVVQETSGALELLLESPLPVVFAVAADRVIDLARRTGAESILSFGLAHLRPTISIETTARNLITSEHADAHGSKRTGEPIVSTLPETLVNDRDARALFASLEAERIPVALSDDAGGYVCNDLYFRLLAAGLRCVFVHLPSHVLSLPDIHLAMRRAIEHAYG